MTLAKELQRAKAVLKSSLPKKQTIKSLSNKIDLPRFATPANDKVKPAVKKAAAEARKVYSAKFESRIKK